MVKLARGKRAYLASAILGQACALVRAILLARFLGPEQLGLAMTVILTAQFFESLSDSGSDRFLVQDRNGNDPSAQALVHLVTFIRGIVVSLILFLCARPISAFFDEPQLATGIQLLAVSSFVMGFINLDFRRLQRDHKFTGEAWVTSVGEFTGVFVTALAAWLTRNYEAALVGLIARSAAMVLVSRLVAERSYVARYSAEHARQLARFGLPLLLNGALLFFSTQGDRVMISHLIDAKTLGQYSAVLLLIVSPSQVLSRFIQSTSLPIIASERDSPQQRSTYLENLATSTLYLAIIQVCAFLLLAPFLAPFLFGRVFQLPLSVIALIGVVQSYRFARLWPTAQALANGASSVVLFNNIVRLVALPLAIAGFYAIGDVRGLLTGFAIGETIAVVLAVISSNRAIGQSRYFALQRMLLLVAFNVSVVSAVSLWSVSVWFAIWPLSLAVLTIFASLVFYGQAFFTTLFSKPLRGAK